MATSPTIMPLTPEINPGLRPVRESQLTQIRNSAAGQGFRFPAGAEAPENWGPPPLKPFQPSHSNPAPTATMATLLGASISRSRWSLGPITAAATKPDTPADTG